MATKPKAFHRGVAPTSLTTVYTVPDAGQGIVTNIVASNSSDTSAAGITVKLDGVALVTNVGIAPHGLVQLDITQVIEAGDTIQIQASTANVSVHISGVEVT